jgi:hypothetical protein
VSEPLILCDACNDPACRLILASEGRRFTCEPHGDGIPSVIYQPGRPENDPLRELPARTLITRMRRQNVERGLLDRTRFAELEGVGYEPATAR